MKKEIAIVSVGTLNMTIIEPMKEPNVIEFHSGLSFNRNPINTALRDEFTRLYNDGYTIETSNALPAIVTYVLVRESK